MKKRDAFTMIELIFSITIMSVFMIAIGFAVNKKAMQKISEPTGGSFYCYKDADNVLHQKSEIFYGSISKVDEKSGIDKCVFDLPSSVKNFNVELIGGGGGASLASAPTISYGILANNNVYQPFSIVSSQIGQRATCQTDAGVPTCGLSNSTEDASSSVLLENKLNNFLDDVTYSSNFLNNIGLVAVGGTDKNLLSGAKCSLIRNFKVGEKVLFYTGLGEVEESYGTYIYDKKYSSSTAAGLKVNDTTLLKAPGKIMKEYVGINSGDFSVNPVCVGGNATTSYNTSTVLYNVRQYQLKNIASISLNTGTNGSAGVYREYTAVSKDKISIDGTVTIPGADIGNGGGVNSPGGETVLKSGGTRLYSVDGGAQGIGPKTVNCGVQKALIQNNQIETRVNPNFVCKSDAYNDDKEKAADVSEYVKAKVFETISLAQQESYYSVPGKCEVQNEKLVCGNAKPSSEVSFGRGGSAAQSAVKYDNIVQFKISEGAKVKSTPVHEPVAVSGMGVGGSGGAIVISW